jgi:hypothetical protein
MNSAMLRVLTHPLWVETWAPRAIPKGSTRLAYLDDNFRPIFRNLWSAGLADTEAPER